MGGKPITEPPDWTAEFRSVLTAQKVLKAAKILNLPIFATTQNRTRLGDTVPELAHLLTTSGPLLKENSDKTRFSMWTPSVERALGRHLDQGSGAVGATAKASVAIVGIEAHICVTQTVIDLLRSGHAVYVLADGVSSCNREEVPLALARLRAEGAIVTSSESWLYELMGDAAVPEFRAIISLVKETSADTTAALRSLPPAPKM